MYFPWINLAVIWLLFSVFLTDIFLTSNFLSLRITRCCTLNIINTVRGTSWFYKEVSLIYLICYSYYSAVVLQQNMPRNKTEVKRDRPDPKKLRTAIQLIQEKRLTLCSAAKHTWLARSPIRRYMQSFKKQAKKTTTLYMKKMAEYIFLSAINCF